MLRAKINSEIKKLSQSFSLTALDIGARNGVKNDLDFIAPIINYYCFEPDRESPMGGLEKKHDYKSLHIIDKAVAENQKTLNINITRQKGCSSICQPDHDIARRFHREDYYFLDDVLRVEADSIDNMVEKSVIDEPRYVKMDVQGMELDILKGAVSSLQNDIVGIRVEINFYPMYKDMPEWVEIDKFLRAYGFVSMGFLELHSWRRRTKIKYPMKGADFYPYSYGQMMHGDVLYLLEPELLINKNADDSSRLLGLFLISLAYGYIDHALVLLNSGSFKDKIYQRYGVDLAVLARNFSLGLGKYSFLCKIIDRTYRAMNRRFSL